VYLLDTNVISLTSPLAGREHQGVRDWLRSVADSSSLSVISVAEMQFGVGRLEARGASRKARALSDWLGDILNAFSDRILPLDMQIGRKTGELLAGALAAGFEPDFQDACIAATAAVNRLVVVTNNVRHFRPLGVEHVIPGA
jgi:predicted nucleic acid-binding protein